MELPFGMSQLAPTLERLADPDDSDEVLVANYRSLRAVFPWSPMDHMHVSPLWHARMFTLILCIERRAFNIPAELILLICKFLFPWAT